jgi:acyl-coenzyme A thioesterase PaaI-like protein
MELEILHILIASAVTGLISTTGTVVALKVHINYLREGSERHEKAITRAHARIDHIERTCKAA